jgi:hypothetical protein
VSGCQTCGGFGGHHDPVTHGQQENDEPCNGICVMGNEVMPGQHARRGHTDHYSGGYYDIAAYPHPDCPRHGRDL